MVRVDSRLISFGGTAIELEFAGTRATEIVEFLFPNRVDDGSADPHLRMRIQENPDDGELEFHCAGELQRKHKSAGIIAHEILEATCFHLAGASTTGVVLHAAALMWEGCAVLFPGRSGSGKTTLSGFLGSQGFQYLSDELIYVASASLAIEAFARPLKIKEAGVKVLDRYLSFGDCEARTLRNDGALLFAAHGERLPSEIPATAIVFPEYAHGVPFQLNAVTPAHAGLTLMECLLNARNLPGHGFSEVTRLARSIPAVSLRYGSLEQVGQHLGSIRSLATPHHPPDTSSER